MRTYLDWNASAPLRREACDAMLAAMEVMGNPSSVHSDGRAARALVERAREQVAGAVGTDADNVVFTSGATEAAALALAYRSAKSAPMEHESVLAWTHAVLPVARDGSVRVAKPPESTLQIANSVTGILQELPAGLLATDATQAFGKVPIAHQIRKAEMAFVSAHKAGGPKGVGALVLRPGFEIDPKLQGGGQEFGHRSGTENTIGIAGFGAAAVAAAKEVANGVWDKVGKLRDLLEEILSTNTDGVVFFGQDSPRLPNTSCLAAVGWKGETQVIQMDLEGFSLSAGSACSSGKAKTSHVFSALGVKDSVASCAIRVSIGPSTTEKQVVDFADTWLKKYLCARSRPKVAKVQSSTQTSLQEALEMGT